MIRLLRTGLRPYRWLIVLVVVLVLVQVIANLYLPTLNADIINNGVVTGDTAYILQVGAVMLGGHARLRARRHRLRLLRLQDVHVARPRHARSALPPRPEASHRPRSTGSARRR